MKDTCVQFAIYGHSVSALSEMFEFDLPLLPQFGVAQIWTC